MFVYGLGPSLLSKSWEIGWMDERSLVPTKREHRIEAGIRVRPRGSRTRAATRKGGSEVDER